MSLFVGASESYDTDAWEAYNIKKENAKLREENAKLQETCAELLKMIERYDPEWLHWPELHDELRELGVEVEDA